jgi:hypothetical protein
MATYTDNFNRADAGSLGSPWSDTNGGFAIVSNTARSETDGLNAAEYVQTYSNDQYSKAIITIQATSYTGVAVRMSDTGTDDYVFFVNPGGSGWVLQKHVSGSVNLDSGAGTFSNGDVIEIRAVGTDISAYKNGAELTTVSDADVASGNAGIMSFQISGVATILDDWEGGDIGGAATNPGPFTGKLGFPLRGKL